MQVDARDAQVERLQMDHTMCIYRPHSLQMDYDYSMCIPPP